MRLNNFSARVIGGKESTSGHVEIEHGTKYSIRISNHRHVRCDARVTVDGKYCGAFRLGPRNSISLERPGQDRGMFTAYVAGTTDGNAAGILDNPDTGLIRVTFTPEKVTTWAVSKNATLEYGGSRGLESGLSFASAKGGGQSMSSTTAPVGTGLSGHSNQSFVDVGGMPLDYSQQTTIHLRLVQPRNSGPRPLTSYSNPVPPRM